MPSGETAQLPRPKRVSGGSAPLKAADNAAWSRRNKFTQNRRASSMMLWSRLAWLTQTTSDGGSSDSEVTAVAVMPWRRVWSAEVMTVTAAGKRRIASLNDERSSSVAASSDMSLSRLEGSASGSDDFCYNSCKYKCLSIKNPGCNFACWNRAGSVTVGTQLLRSAGAQA